MRNATEKILHASTEAQRPVVMGQLETISKRIQNLESDLKAYERAAESAPDSGDEDVRSKHNLIY